MSDEFEFSRPYALDKLGAGQEQVEIEASAKERRALAERLGLRAIDRLTARLSIAADPAAKLVSITGKLDAEVTQSCVVSLAPVEQRVSEAFEQSYTLVPVSEEDEEEGLDPDAPESLPEGGLDLGEEVAQQLSLALDPYPRAADAVLPDSARDKQSSPFAVLAKLGTATGQEGEGQG